MERKLITASCLAGIALAFGVVSLLVVLSRRHPFFVEKKLRLGALILTLSGVIAACGSGSPFSPQVMCYDPIPENYITIDRYDYSTGLTISRTDTITGAIDSRRGTVFSFGITDTAGSFFCKDDLHPADGIFDESTEEFTIVLPESIIPGNYQLKIAPVPKDSIENADYYLQSFDLTISE